MTFLKCLRTRPHLSTDNVFMLSHVNKAFISALSFNESLSNVPHAATRTHRTVMWFGDLKPVNSIKGNPIMNFNTSDNDLFKILVNQIPPVCRSCIYAVTRWRVSMSSLLIHLSQTSLMQQLCKVVDKLPTYSQITMATQVICTQGHCRLNYELSGYSFGWRCSMVVSAFKCLWVSSWTQ